MDLSIKSMKINNDITLSYLSSTLRSMGPITITKDFIKYRNEHADKFNDYGRTEEEKIRNSDALLVEYMLINGNHAQRPKNIVHDFIINEKHIDNKMLSEDATTVTIPNRKEGWMKSAVVYGDLTHFSISKWVSRPDECKGDKGRCLREGDVVELDIVSVMDAREALRSLQDSFYYANSKFFWVK